MSFTQFVKPYPDGYQDFESGGTPVTAAILNTNYDGFLLALNSWAANTEFDISSLGSGLTQAHERITSLEGTVSTKSTVTIRDLLSSGTKIGTIAINGSDYDLYAPSGGGGGSSVTWNQIQQTGTKIAEVTIDNTTYDVYSPTPIDEISDLTDVSITNLQNGQILKWNSTTSKWENSNESGGGTGGHTIIDENGNSMTARAGLQFVGADVSDDATNNKTIVDLASAGGIDGVFIDTENIIQSETSVSVSSSSSPTYTATEDCCILIYFGSLPAGSNFAVRIDNVGYYYFASNENGKTFPIFVKKGQEIKFTTNQSVTVYYTIYGIQTGTTHSKFQPVIYSLEEREIGVWSDGKPLYQKTFELTIPDGSSAYEHTFTEAAIPNLDKAVATSYSLFGTGERAYVPWYSQATVILDEQLSTGVTFYFGSNNYAGRIIYYTVRYTKTTDTAGSGTWTPQGVPAHHYSTDEQIVGTWVDGKTLYEKTYVFSNSIQVSSSSWTASEIDTSLIETFVKVKGLSTNGDSYDGLITAPINNRLNFMHWFNNIGIKTVIVQYTKSS